MSSFINKTGKNINNNLNNLGEHLTLFPTAYPFPLCYGGGCFSPPQLETYLGVIDSNFFIHTNKTMSN